MSHLRSAHTSPQKQDRLVTLADLPCSIWYLLVGFLHRKAQRTIWTILEILEPLLAVNKALEERLGNSVHFWQQFTFETLEFEEKKNYKNLKRWHKVLAKAKIKIDHVVFEHKGGCISKALDSLAKFRIRKMSFAKEIGLSDRAIRKIPNIKELEIKGCSSKIAPEALQTLAKNCPNLRLLILSECHPIAACHEYWSGAFTQLDYLSLAWCRAFSDSDLSRLQCSKLQSLILTGCNRITDKGLEVLPLQLQHLGLAHCNLITDAGLKVLPLQLRHLSLAHCNLITDAGLEVLPLQLLHLSLAYCDKITDAGLEVLPRHLQHLGLARCNRITDVGLGKLATRCSKLQRLNMRDCSGITGKGVALLAKNCHELNHLNLSYCREISDQDFQSFFAESFKFRYLNLQCCSGILSTSIARVVRASPDLRHLNVSAVGQITDDVLDALAQTCGSELQYLEMVSADITDVGFGKLARSCQKLQTLNLTGCTELTDEAFQALAQLSDLQELHLGSCRIGTKGLTAIAKLPRLRALHIAFCERFSADDLMSLATSPSQSALRHLDLNFCNQINVEQVQQLQSKLPLLVIKALRSRNREAL